MTNPLEELTTLIQNHPDKIFDRFKQFVSVNNDFEHHIQTVVTFIRNGYVPIVYANHQSHADGLILSIVTGSILASLKEKSLRGFLCPIAASMQTGDQHATVQEASNIFLPLFASQGFITLPVIREADRTKYGLVGSNQEVLQKILEAPKNNYGLAVFPEGTVQGGRKRKDDSIYGMQQAEQAALIIRCMAFWKDQGRESVLLPIGINKSYLLFSPDKYDISQDLMTMVMSNQKTKHIASAVLGKPFTTQDILTEFHSLLNAKDSLHHTYLMKKVAKLLPDDAQGYYKDR